VRFIDEHRDRFGGVEPICRVLTGHGWKIAPSTYYAAKTRPRSAREIRDERLAVHIRRVHQDNYGVYGAHKVWCQLNREGIEVARCTVARLMGDPGLHGATRGNKIVTTRPGQDGHRAGDLLHRDFTAPAPNHRWVADFTHVATWAGIVYVAFVVDIYSRAIVGWSASTNKRTRFVLDALQIALWRRDRDGRPVGKGLIHHSDAGSQGGFNRWSQHLDDGGVGWVAGRGRYWRGGWVRGGSGRRIGRCGRRCVLLAGRSPRVRCSGRSGG
jgi:putative transposase